MRNLPVAFSGIPVEEFVLVGLFRPSGGGGDAVEVGGGFVRARWGGGQKIPEGPDLALTARDYMTRQRAIIGTRMPPRSCHA
jgi:hypothetical protein